MTDELTLQISGVHRSNRGYYSCEGWHVENSTLQTKPFISQAILKVIGEFKTFKFTVKHVTKFVKKYA